MPKSSTDIASALKVLAARKANLPEAKAVHSPDSLLLLTTHADNSYVVHMKPLCRGHSVHVNNTSVKTLTELRVLCKNKRTTKVLSTSVPLLKLLLNWEKRAAPSLNDYAGSYFSIPGLREGDPEIEIIFLRPLAQLVTLKYGRELISRMVEKFTKASRWYTPTEFKWSMLTADKVDEKLALYEKAAMICVDVETIKDPMVIRCLSYTALFEAPGTESGYTSDTIVLTLQGLKTTDEAMFWLAVMRKFNDLPAAKILQNGKYDCAYFFMYGAPLRNYLWDTANLFHCWFSEMPKDLGFLNAYFIRKAMYWKDLAETNDLMEYYRYSALDTWGTANTFIAMLLELPRYVIRNYALEFPLVFPTHMFEMRGIKRDLSRLDKAAKEVTSIIEEYQGKLDTILGLQEGESFNVNSPKQMKQLLFLLGCKDLPSADEKNLKKAKGRHPLNARIINYIISIRKHRKLLSTYLTEGKEYKGRILSALNPHATDTGRLASKEHHFWCGVNLQNIPRGPAVKQTYQADDGFILQEVDYSQAESRDTAYISGDETLIYNVEHSPDFHSSNAAGFFGVPFEEIFDVATGKVLRKDLRTLGKPVNHGCNYCMGALVLVDTMGEDMILQAKNLLGLNRMWSYVRVAEYLIDKFHVLYDSLRKVFYTGVIEEVTTTGFLRSQAIIHNRPDVPDTIDDSNFDIEFDRLDGGWSRRTFGNPAKNKLDMNAYVAHGPQNLNAMTLNRAYWKVFVHIAINPKHSDNFKLGPQIHDSIQFQYREGHEYLVKEVEKLMEIPITVKAYDGKVRTFIVPAEAGDIENKAKYWSEI